MEVDRPRAERCGECGHRGVEGGGLVVVILGDDAVRLGVGAERVEVGVGHVGLEADDLRHADGFEEIHHVFPRVHAAPANFTFGGEALAVVLGDFAGFAEGLRDELGGALRIFVPSGDACGAIDADDAVGADAELAEFFRDADGLADVGDEVGAGFFIAAGGGIEPDGGHDGADDEAACLYFGGEGFDAVVRNIDVGVGVVEEEIDPVEFHATDLGFGGEVEHGVEFDERLSAGRALADETGPGCVVKFWEVIGGHVWGGVAGWELRGEGRKV